MADTDYDLLSSVLIVAHVITTVSVCQRSGAVHVLSFLQAILGLIIHEAVY
jgi:hypothetical protein